MVSPRSGAVCPTGAHPGNTGGKKGRSGRPPKAFKSFLAELRQKPAVQQTLETVLLDPSSTNYGRALSVLTEYDEERPATRMKMEQAIPRDQLLELATQLAGAVREIVTDPRLLARIEARWEAILAAA